MLNINKTPIINKIDLTHIFSNKESSITVLIAGAIITLANWIIWSLLAITGSFRHVIYYPGAFSDTSGQWLYIVLSCIELVVIFLFLIGHKYINTALSVVMVPIIGALLYRKFGYGGIWYILLNVEGRFPYQYLIYPLIMSLCYSLLTFIGHMILCTKKRSN